MKKKKKKKKGDIKKRKEKDETKEYLPWHERSKMGFSGWVRYTN